MGNEFLLQPVFCFGFDVDSWRHSHVFEDLPWCLGVPVNLLLHRRTYLSESRCIYVDIVVRLTKKRSMFVLFALYYIFFQQSFYAAVK